MANQVTENSPLAQALQAVVQPKLVELGWSTGGLDDSALSEYVILMLVNDKTQDQISSELSNDLLGLGPDDPGAAEFSKWLFEQLHILRAQSDGVQQTGTPDVSSGPMTSGHNEATQSITSIAGQDAEMADGVETSQPQIPTGPKAMRNANQSANPNANLNTRDKRMVNQINRTLDRNGDAALHRVQNRGGTGRVNSHSREPPKGRRGMHSTGMHPAGGAGMNMGRGAMLNNPMMYGGLGPMNGSPMAARNNAANMFAQFGQWAKQMGELPPEIQAQYFQSQGMGMPFVPPNFQNPGAMPQGPRPGKSLFERAERPPQRRESKFNQHKQHQDTDMGDAPDGDGEAASSVGGENAKDKDPFEVVCRFNKSCTKPDCPFAHQTPAAHHPVTVDLSDTCGHGVACKNYRCTARHPSPAKIAQHHAEENCKYWPNCTNPHCTFKHVPLCRNGADCTTPDCKFMHVKVQCKFNPCLNKTCPFKHSEGQARGKFADKVWTADGEKKEHVSERKFVADVEDSEELIIPAHSNASSSPGTVTAEPVVT